MNACNLHTNNSSASNNIQLSHTENQSVGTSSETPLLEFNSIENKSSSHRAIVPPTLNAADNSWNSNVYLQSEEAHMQQIENGSVLNSIEDYNIPKLNDEGQSKRICIKADAKNKTDEGKTKMQEAFKNIRGNIADIGRGMEACVQASIKENVEVATLNFVECKEDIKQCKESINNCSKDAYNKYSSPIESVAIVTAVGIASSILAPAVVVGAAAAAAAAVAVGTGAAAHYASTTIVETVKGMAQGAHEGRKRGHQEATKTLKEKVKNAYEWVTSLLAKIFGRQKQQNAPKDQAPTSRHKYHEPLDLRSAPVEMEGNIGTSASAYPSPSYQAAPVEGSASSRKSEISPEPAFT